MNVIWMKQKPFALTALAILIMCEVVSVVCLHEGFSGLIFFLFQIGGLILPGIAFLSFIGRLEIIDWEICAEAYFTGYCITLFEYFVFMLMGIQEYIKYIVVCIGLASFVYISCCKSFKINTEHENEVARREKILFIVFLSVVFLITLFASCCCNLVQPVVNNASPVIDMLYWVQDIIELTREFPPVDFRTLQPGYTYHYFAAAQLAFSSIVTSIRPIYIAFFFSATQSVLLKVFGAYLVLKACNASYWLKIFGMILLFFSSGRESKVIITYLAHSYNASFGLEYAFSFFLFFWYLLIKKNKESKNDIVTAVAVWIVLFVLSGEKIAYGAIALSGLGVICIAWLLKKDYIKSVMTGIPALILFLVEYFTIINTTRYSNVGQEGGGGIISPIYIGYMNDLLVSIENVTSIFHLSGVPFFYIVYMFWSNPVALFIVCYNTFRLTRYKKWDGIDFAFLSMYIVGFVCTILMSMYGTSNMYFAMVSFPAAIIWLVRCNLPWTKASKMVLAVFSFMSIMGFVTGYAENMSLYDYIADGIYAIINNNVKDEYIDERTYVDSEEYEAYDWIRMNTDENDIISMNRESSIVSVMSERYCINPRYGNSIYNCETDIERDIMMEKYLEMGVKYIIFDIKYDGDESYIRDRGRPVYSTDNITIYEI